jgi:hypothetical protein
VATTARESITPVLEKARADAKSAQTIATDALQTSKEVKRIAEQTKQQLAELKVEVGKRVVEVRNLYEEVQKSKSAIAAQSKELKAVAQQVKTVTTEKNTQRIRQAFPAAFGDRLAVYRGGYIDPSEKTTQDVYVTLVFALSSAPRSKLDPTKIGQVTTSLEEHKYRVFEGGVDLTAKSDAYTTGLGANLGVNSCQQLAKLGPPCILYFRETLQAKALEVRDLIRVAQIVPNERIRFVDPMKLDSLMQELIQKSAVDIVIVISDI